MLEIFFLIAGLYMFFKKEVKISSKRSIKGKIAQKIGIIFIIPALLSYVINFMPQGPISVILAYVSLAAFAVAFVIIIYLAFFYKSNNNKNSSDILSVKTESSKIIEEQSNKNTSNNFFRKDLNLKGRWWHRLFFVVFVVAFIWIGWVTISSMLDDAQLPKYTKVGMLSDRMDSEIRLIGGLVKPEEKIAVYEHNLYGEYNGKKFYDGNGGWLLKQEYYCSKNISDQLEEIISKTGASYYKGNDGWSSLNDYKNYLIKNKATCVFVESLDRPEYFDGVKIDKVISWGLEAEDMAVWQESLVKSVFAVLQVLFFLVLGLIILLVLYYKVFLYIVFGSKKDTK